MCEFWANMDRALPVSDSSHRELYLSLGCCLGNFLLAADAFGYSGNVEYFPDDSKKDFIARVHIEKKSNQGIKNNILDAIVRRRSNRMEYKEDKVETEKLDRIISFENPGEMEIRFISQEHQLKQIKEIMMKAFAVAVADKTFRMELADWVRSNISSAPDGMPGYTLGIPTLPSLAFPFVLRHFDPSKMIVRENRGYLEKTPVIGVLSIRKDEPSGWVRAGELFEKIWVEATQLGLSVNVLNAGVEMGNMYKEIQNMIVSQLRPVMLWRLGYSKHNVERSMRIPLFNILKNDQTNTKRKTSEVS